MTDDEIIAILKARRVQKRIERRIAGGSQAPEEGWSPLRNAGEVRWNFDTFEYRIAPEPRKPREWDMVVHRDGCLYQTGGYAYGETIRVREVIE